MEQEQHTESFRELSKALEEIHQKLIKLSNTDFSKIHVGHPWTWMPYVKDHLQFLAEQTGGMLAHLEDSPPPTSIEVDKNMSTRVVENDIQQKM